MLRILHVVPTYLPATRYGGPIHSVHGLCRALATRGHRVTVLTTNVDGPNDSDVPLDRPVLRDGVEVRYCASRYARRLYYSPTMRPVANELLLETDVVHLHSVFLWPTSMVARLAHARSVPYVLAPRGMLVPELVRQRSRWVKTAWLKLVEQRTLRDAACWHATSEAEVLDAKRMRLVLPAPFVIPNGVDEASVPDVSSVRQEIREVTTQPFVLFLGRIHWKKGLDRLLDALQGTGIRLVIAGGDEEALRAELNHRALRLGIGDQVVFVGEVHDADKAHLLSAARFLALTSYNENFGNSVVEAMAAGTAVLVSVEVGAAAAVRAAAAGVVVEGDVTAIREGLKRLWSDATARTMMGNAGRSYVAEVLSWKAIAERTERMYLEMRG